MRLYLLLLCSLLLPTTSDAQNIFQSELDQATAIVQQRRGSFVVVRMAQFKLDALRYLQAQTTNANSTKTFAWLDAQAYHLSSFLYLYRQLFCQSSLPEADAHWLREHFRQASLDNPVVHDNEGSSSSSFSHEGEMSIVPFSFDTDWGKALTQITQQLSNSPYAEQANTLLQSLPH